MVHDPVVSGTATRSQVELFEYQKDALPEIQQDYPSFTTFSISGSSITPAPDIVDQRLIVLKVAENITLENYQENVGDAILIRQGSINLDTSKGTRYYADLLDRIKDRYDQLIMSLNMNGKSSTTTSIGLRIDNYSERKGETTASDSYL